MDCLAQRSSLHHHPQPSLRLFCLLTKVPKHPINHPCWSLPHNGDMVQSESDNVQPAVIWEWTPRTADDPSIERILRPNYCPFGKIDSTLIYKHYTPTDKTLLQTTPNPRTIPLWHLPRYYSITQTCLYTVADVHHKTHVCYNFRLVSLFTWVHIV